MLSFRCCVASLAVTAVEEWDCVLSSFVDVVALFEGGIGGGRPMFVGDVAEAGTFMLANIRRKCRCD